MTIVLHRHRRDEDSLLAPATRSNGPAPELPAEAPFAPSRLGCAPGTSADVLRDLRNAAAREQARQDAAALARAYDSHGIPPGFRVRAVDLDAVGASMTTVEDNLAAIREALSGPHAHTARMLLMPHAARIAELLGAGTVHELRAPSGCCPECGDRFELDGGRVPTHYPTGGTGQCPGSGNEPEGSAR